ncbi:MAG: M15 family metallopeptidase [Legionella sp.]|nr:M15 family metallopeptidase [Legionella sp.]
MPSVLMTLLLTIIASIAHALPKGFVYLQSISPDISEDMRYVSANNFIGRPISGYQKGRCILTSHAAYQLAEAEKEAQRLGYRLKVYDCYRPQRAVNDFYKWSQDPLDILMKNEFYPRENKATLFSKGYISKASGHTRGSTVDLTLVKINNPTPLNKAPSVKCYSKTNQHTNDDSINTGTRFDCLDKSASVFYNDLTKEQLHNRLMLRNLMKRHGFYPYEKEWWHFTLKNEPYPSTYFDFPVR